MIPPRSLHLGKAKLPLLCFLLLSLSSCGSFPKAVKKIKQNKLEEAKVLLQRSMDHPTYGLGARYYWDALRINDDPRTTSWLEINQNFCQLEKQMKELPSKQYSKLVPHDASRPDVIDKREKLQRRIVDRMSRMSTISELLILEEKTDCWPERTVDSLRKIIVNKTIDPTQEVFETEADQEWTSPPLLSPPEDSILTEAGRSCWAFDEVGAYNISYEDATIIMKQYAEVVLPGNYGDLWEIRRKIWNIFQTHHSYCEMDRFKEEYPRHLLTQDCWYDQARDTLCLGQLRPLLAFHRNNPHTALDKDICEQIICVYLIKKEESVLGNAGDLRLADLDSAEYRQLMDIKSMLELRKELDGCEERPDSVQMISDIAELARKYTHHKVVFDLAKKCLDYLGGRRYLELAREALQTFRPLFPDTSVCASDFVFQVNKQQWFDGFEALLERAAQEPILPLPVSEWNTKEYDEYALVSWGDTDEVFFTRRDRTSGKALVMTSRRKKGEWTKPVSVDKLSLSDDVIPLSISADGRLMLLRSEGKLMQVSRPDVGRPWWSPNEFDLPSLFAGNAWLSPDDSLMMVEYYSDPPASINRPKVDIMVAKLREDGNYGRPVSIGEQVNLPFYNEGRPLLALKGRMLFYTSDRLDGVGLQDMYSASLSRPNDWTTLSQPKNLGLPLNTLYEDVGITYFSEYTNRAYFHRLDRCSEDLDIWQVKLGSDVFPENAMRLAGVVLDENGRSIGGGFMEFTADYQLNVHSEPISSNGTYTYTVLDSTEVVRLFPEIPGYYSERDTTHFLADIEKGEIIRDTFVLISFDYIRRNFKLVHSTFINGEAVFDRPEKAYPELNRLAKIATRMGANLELHGHTDDFGTPEENKKLSYDRAISVKEFLVRQCGFDRKITVVGHGATQPKCTNETEEGRRCNRRVEVFFEMPDLPSEGK